MKLSRRLLLLILSALLPLTAVLFFNLYSLYQSREKEVHAQAFRQGQLVALEMQRILNGMQSVLLTVAASPAAQAFEIDRCNSLLSRASKKLPGVATIGVLDTTGVVRCRSTPEGIGSSLADRRYFQEAIKTGSFVVGDYTKSRITGRAVLPLAVGYTDNDGKPLGVVAMSLDLDWLQSLLAQRQFDEGAALTIADRHGVILARYPDPGRFVGTVIPEKYQYLVSAKNPGTIELISQDGTRRILAYFPVNSVPAGLYVSTGSSVQTSFYSIEYAALISVGASILVLLLALGLAWQTSRYAIRAPVQRILSAISAWREERTEVRTGMNAGAGEFGEIGAAIDTFMDEVLANRRHREVLEAEMSHRIKNLMAVVRAVASRTFTDQRTRDEALQVFGRRLSSMTDAFGILEKGQAITAQLDTLVRTAVRPFDNPDDSPFSISGPDVQLNSKAALAISMTLHELCTNAVKYGALGELGGAVLIRWAVKEKEDLLEFTWQEQDGPAVKPPEKTGFGSQMIEKALASQTRGAVEVDYADTGLKFKLTAPLNELTKLEPS